MRYSYIKYILLLWLIFLSSQIIFSQNSKYYKVFNVGNCQYPDTTNCTNFNDKKIINVGGTFKFDCNRDGSPKIKKGYVEIARVAFDAISKTYKANKEIQIDKYDIEYGYRQRDKIKLKYIKDFGSTAISSYDSICYLIYIKDAYVDSITLNDILKIQSYLKFRDEYIFIRLDNCYIDTIKIGKFSFDEKKKDSIGLSFYFNTCYFNEINIQNTEFDSNSTVSFSDCNSNQFSISNCIFKNKFSFTRYETRENSFLPHYGVINNNDKIEFYKSKNDISIFKSSFYDKVELIFSDSLYNYNFTDNNLFEEIEPFLLTHIGLTSNLNLSLNKCNREIRFWGTFNNCNIHDIHTTKPLGFDNVEFINSTIERIYTDIPIEIQNSFFSESIELGSVITSNKETKFIVENNFSSFNFSDLEKVFFNADNFIYKTTQVFGDFYKSRNSKPDFFFNLDNFFQKYEDYVRNKYTDKNPNKMDAVLAHMNYNKESIIYEYCKKTNSWWRFWYFFKKCFINFGYNGIWNLFVISILIITLFASIYFYKFKDHLVGYLKLEHKDDDYDKDINTINKSDKGTNYKNLSTINQFFKRILCSCKIKIYPCYGKLKSRILRIVSHFSRIREYKLASKVFFIFGLLFEIFQLVLKPVKFFLFDPVCFLLNIFKSSQAKNVVLCLWFSFRAFIDIRFPIKYFKFENKSLFYIILIEWLIGIIMIYVLVSNFYYKIPLLTSIIGV